MTLIPVILDFPLGLLSHVIKDWARERERGLLLPFRRGMGTRPSPFALPRTLPGKPRAHGLRSRHPLSPLPSPLSVTTRASPSQERRRGHLPATGERRRRKSVSRGPKAEALLPAPARGLETAVPGLRRRHVLCVPAAPCCWGALLVRIESSSRAVCVFRGARKDPQPADARMRGVYTHPALLHSYNLAPLNRPRRM